LSEGKVRVKKYLSAFINFSIITLSHKGFNSWKPKKLLALKKYLNQTRNKHFQIIYHIIL
jgi:hypothetical protein